MNKRASNIACRAELGRYPLKLSTDKRILNYVLHLKSQPNSSIVNQAFIISKQLHNKGQNSFYTNATNVLISQNMTIDNISTKFDINTYTTNAKTTYINFFKAKLENSTKLRFYNSFKSDHDCEQYLSYLDDPNQKKLFTKFRISNHSLMIETGRYTSTKTPRENRKCLVCDLDQIDGEHHLMISCACCSAISAGTRSSDRAV